MKKIKLSDGSFAKVDDKHYEDLNQYKWHPFKHRNTIYAKTNWRASKKNNYKSGYLLMHRVILKLTDPKIVCDHINHNGLDNRELNLRSCTSSQNCLNRLKTKGTSKYLGVHLIKSSGRWSARIQVKYKGIRLGNFINEKDAARVYNKAAIKYFGEFANLNKV